MLRSLNRFNLMVGRSSLPSMDEFKTRLTMPFAVDQHFRSRSVAKRLLVRCRLATSTVWPVRTHCLVDACNLRELVRAF